MGMGIGRTRGDRDCPDQKLRGVRRCAYGGAAMKRGRKPKTELSPEIAAISRLSEDGASSNAAIRKRIALIAAERKLPAAETKKVMGRLLTYDIKLFTEKHH